MKNNKGLTIVNFCPSCLTRLLSIEDAKTIVKLFPKELTTTINDILVKSNCASLGIFEPTTEEFLLLLDHRLVLYPMCHRCAVGITCGKKQELIEKNLAWSRRTQTLLKIQKSEEGVE